MEAHYEFEVHESSKGMEYLALIGYSVGNEYKKLHKLQQH